MTIQEAYIQYELELLEDSERFEVEVELGPEVAERGLEVDQESTPPGRYTHSSVEKQMATLFQRFGLRSSR